MQRQQVVYQPAKRVQVVMLEGLSSAGDSTPEDVAYWRRARERSSRPCEHGQAGEEILDAYEQERRPHATRTIRAAVTIGWALTGGQDRAAIIRRIALASLCRLPGFTTAVAGSASPRLTGSALLDHRRLSPQDATGRLCPQPAVTVGPDQDRLDALLGDGWALLTDGLATAPAGVRHIDISALGPSGSAQLRRWLRGHRTHAILVRPDRIIAATGRRALTTRIPAIRTGPVSR